ncbi:MAG: hypothetical protein WC560_12390 [Syntrophales bacterium]
MDNVLIRIFDNLTSYISEYQVLSETEIRQAIKSEIEKLDKESKKRLGEQLEGDPVEAILESLVSSPMSVFSPSLVKRDYLEETFYTPHVHRSFMDEMEQAFKRLINKRASTILPRLEMVISGFLGKAGYTSFTTSNHDEPVDSRELTATKGDSSLRLLLLPTIAFAHQCRDRADIIVVPTENTPALFVRFYREQNLEGIDTHDIKMWVVDSDKATVSPFLGDCADKEITRNFDNPELKEKMGQYFRSMKL